eukprot:TRINITY_DN2951_c0_g3_i1.p1 TRINITY_DN2951_c0_g3~~TRINITY_DN2951_c0_g3_i1.p1  ORF type:complete len:210 (+),score=69.38 TRINITY_DN2951_c0_g3_i1:105-734(+)
MESRYSSQQNGGEEGKNTLGLERHVNSVFQQTKSTISTLNAELDSCRKRNEELQLKLQDLYSQKEKLINRNKQLENEERTAKKESEELLKVKNDCRQEIKSLRAELQEINDVWENKKKGLQHSINELEKQQLSLVDERNRENQAYEQAILGLKKNLESVNRDIVSTTEEIGKHERLIAQLKERESVSMNTIMFETSKFKEFLEQQMNNP